MGYIIKRSGVSQAEAQLPMFPPPTSNLQVTTASVVECGGHRFSSRSVSWNSRGDYLGFASSDRMARLVAVDSAASSTREVLVISGHTGPVTKIKFHPHEDNTLLTAALDQTVRLWDCRQAAQKSLGSFHVKELVSVDWCPESPQLSQYIVVTERRGQVCVFDRRKLAANRNNVSGSVASPRVTPVHTFDRLPNVVDKAIFGPGGQHLIGGLTYDGDGMSDLGVWRWMKNENSMDTGENIPLFRYPAHAGPIYSMALSNDGKRLATGGSDATIGLWDTSTMICTHTISNPITRLVRCVSFSYDSDVLAFCNDENDVFLADASSGVSLGSVVLGHRRSGAEEVAWHPKNHILACARTEFMGDRGPLPIAIAKLVVSRTA